MPDDKHIYNLDLHECMEVVTGMTVMRVASGWLYDVWDYDRDCFKRGVFVSFDNNFQKITVPRGTDWME